MRTIEVNDFGNQVMVLQQLLTKAGFQVVTNGDFNDSTKHIVQKFQSQNGLVNDGIVGPKTWGQLFRKGYSLSLGTTNYSLEYNEFMHEYFDKKSIYLHHTAGDHRPDYTIAWWEKDNRPGKLNRVGTAFVIGRKSRDGDSSYDGVTYRAFPEYYWAHHLGLKSKHLRTTTKSNTYLNRQSIGIEICSLGPLQKGVNDKFFFQSGDIKKSVHENDVCILDNPWRGHRYFQKYTDKQISECKRLLLTLGFIFDIQFPEYDYDESWFELNSEALNGVPGLWTHCNVRPDKTDCFPQPEIIQMLNELHNESKDFVPTADSLESIVESSVQSSYDLELIENYTIDLEDVN